MQECESFGTCKEGSIKTTKGYLLPAKHVIHVVLNETYRTSSKDVLRNVLRKVLHTADSLGATSLAIPTIGLGMLGYPAQECITIAMEEVKGFLESMEFTRIEKIGKQDMSLFHICLLID
jgi:O-acetyl-ADP-ribose deacetylase (regulator of RNase III)